jgi:hypothetical protein
VTRSHQARSSQQTADSMKIRSLASIDFISQQFFEFLALDSSECQQGMLLVLGFNLQLSCKTLPFRVAATFSSWLEIDS